MLSFNSILNKTDKSSIDVLHYCKTTVKFIFNVYFTVVLQ